MRTHHDSFATIGYVKRPLHVTLITGSRRWPKAEPEPIHRALQGTELLIVGDAPGVDAIALDWALANDCIAHVYCADTRNFALLRGMPSVYVEQASDWTRQKKRAGPIRNARMVKAAVDMQMTLGCKVWCHAFPLPGSTGTWDCHKQCGDAGLDITVFDPEVEP